MDVLITQITQQLSLPISSMAASAVHAIEQSVLNHTDSDSVSAAASAHTNITTTPGGSPSLASLGLLSSFSALWALLLSYPALRDGAKLFVLGGAIEFARRTLMYVWSSFVDSFFITAEFADGDETFSESVFFLLFSFHSAMVFVDLTIWDYLSSVDNVLALQAAQMEPSSQRSSQHKSIRPERNRRPPAR